MTAPAPISVLHVFKTHLPDNFEGVPRVIDGIARGTAALGVRSSVLSLSADPAAGPVEVNGYRTRKARLDAEIASTGLSLSFFGLFREEAARADLVHYHAPWPLMDLAHFRVRHGRPSIVTYHADFVRQRLLGVLYRPLLHAFLARADRIVATSPNVLESSPILARHRDRAEVIPLGFERADYPVPDEATRAHWRSRFAAGYFLFVGAMRHYKGLETLIEAAALTGLPVVLLGSGERQAALQATARERRLGNVHFLGRLEETHKMALIEGCTALVLPSHLRAEAFGVVLVEASMNARPMISCEIGTGTSYVNLDEITGVVVPPRDPAALATAMRRLWDDRALAGRMGRAAADRHARLFTGAGMARGYAGLYRRVLAEHAP